MNVDFWKKSPELKDLQLLQRLEAFELKKLSLQLSGFLPTYELHY